MAVYWFFWPCLKKYEKLRFQYLQFFLCAPKVETPQFWYLLFALEDAADHNNTDILNSGVLKYSISNFHQCHATTNFTSTICAVTCRHFIRYQCLGSPPGFSSWVLLSNMINNAWWFHTWGYDVLLCSFWVGTEMHSWYSY